MKSYPLRRILPHPIASTVLPFLLSLASASAGTYTWVATSSKSWNSNSGDRWNPTTGLTVNGPLSTDHVVFGSTANGTLQLNGMRAALSFTNERDGARIQATTSASGVTIGGNLTVNAGTRLDFYGSETISMEVEVGDDAVVGGTLDLGGTSGSTGRMKSFSVNGSTVIGSSGRLNNIYQDGDGSHKIESSLGNLQVASGGALVVIQRGARTANDTINADNAIEVRSLQGNGTIYGTDYIGANLTRTATLNITASSTADFGGTLQDTEGTIETGAVNTLTVNLSGNGTQILSGANTYTGQTAVNSGTLLVNGTHIQSSAAIGGGDAADGIYRVKNGGALGGTGRIAAWGTEDDTNMVLVESGGAVAPGASIGTLTLDGKNIAGTGSAILNMKSGAEFEFELAGNGTAGDRVRFWNYDGVGDFLRTDNVINLTLVGAPEAGVYTVVLFDFFSDDGSTATASGISSGLTLTGASIDPDISSASLVFNTNNISLQYTVIPEPATAAFVLLAGFGWIIRCRTRSQRGMT